MSCLFAYIVLNDLNLVTNLTTYSQSAKYFSIKIKDLFTGKRSIVRFILATEKNYLWSEMD